MRDPGVLQLTQCRPPPFLFFRKRCVGAYVPPAAHCYLSSKRKRLQFLLDVFLCLFSFCSFQWNQKRKKQVSTCGYMRVRLCACVCVRCVWLYVYLCGSRRCAAVREPEVKRTQAVSYKLSNRCLELLIFGFTPCCISTMGKVFIHMGKGVTCGVLIITRLWRSLMYTTEHFRIILLQNLKVLNTSCPAPNSKKCFKN